MARIESITVEESIELLSQTIEDLIKYMSISTVQKCDDEAEIQSTIGGYSDGVASQVKEGAKTALDEPKFHSETSSFNVEAEQTAEDPQNNLQNNLVLVSPDHTERCKLVQARYTDINFNKRQKTVYDLDDHLLEDTPPSNEWPASRNNSSSTPDSVRFANDELSKSPRSSDTARKLSHQQNQQLFKKFNLKSLPAIAITEYIQRLQKYLKFSTSVLVTSSYYIYRLIYVARTQPKASAQSLQGDESAPSRFQISELNSYRLVLTSLRIAGKLIEDLNHSQKFFAQVSGIKKTELGKLETILLFLLNFDLKVDTTILNNHLDNLDVLHKCVQEHV